MSKANTRNVGAGSTAKQKPSKNSIIQFKKTAVASSLGVCLAMMAAPSVAEVTSITGQDLTLSASNTENITDFHGIWLSNSGISLLAEDTMGSSDTSTAVNILANKINNFGSIDSSLNGIYLKADAGDVTFTVSENENATVTSKIHNNEIYNSGTIVSVDNGIYLEAITGSASISGSSSNDSDADVTSEILNNKIYNSGTIVSLDNGIYLEAITGSASISGTSGTDSSASVKAKISDNVIINSGTIISLDNGIYLYATKGTASVSGGAKSEEAIISYNEISNIAGGRIISGDVGIKISSDTVDYNTIEISGLIVSDFGLTVDRETYTRSQDSLGTAIEISGSVSDSIDGYNTLDIVAPAYLAGEILLDDDAQVKVSLSSGPSHSVRWSINENDTVIGQVNQGLFYETDLTKAKLIGAVPWFFNDTISGGYDIYATIDPSAFAAAPNMLGDLSGMVSSLARVGLEKNDLGKGLWVAIKGGERTYEGDPTATMEQKTTHAGAAIGYAHRLSEDWRVSGSIGANQGRLEVGSFYADVYANSFKNKANGGFLGLHFAGSLGPVKMNIGISGGANSHKDRRFVNDNLQWWGIDHAAAKYDSTWYSPEIAFAIPIKWDSGWSFTPSLSWRYSGQHIEGYTETGSDAYATVASRTLGVSEANLTFDVTRAYGSGSSISGMLGYLYRGSVGDNNVQVEMIGDTRDVPFFYKDLSAGIAGINWKLNIKNDISVYLNANYMKGSNVEGGDVSTGLKVDF